MGRHIANQFCQCGLPVYIQVFENPAYLPEQVVVALYFDTRAVKGDFVLTVRRQCRE